MPAEDELEVTLRAYRKSRFVIICHAAFLVLCLGGTFIARRMMGLPPQVLTTVIIVALIVFGKDIMKFFQLRSRVAQLRRELKST